MLGSAVITSKGTKGFLTWLKNAQPAVYAAVRSIGCPGLGPGCMMWRNAW